MLGRLLGDNKSFLATVITIIVVGLISVANTSAPLAQASFNDSLFYFKQQLVWAILGLFLLIFCSNIPVKTWERMAKPFLLFSVFLLIIVLIPGIGSSFLGARRWIIAGPISIQPSEVAKLSVCLYMASLATKKVRFKNFLYTLIGVCALVMFQPDLGTTILLILIGYTQMFIAGLPLTHIIVSGVAGIVVTVISILFSPYRRDRLMTFLGNHDPHDTSYHVRQIILALGSGGLFGTGIGQSKQKHLFLPETATDSVFAVIAEEVGFFGGLIIILTFAFLVFQILSVARKSKSSFGRVFATGVAFWIGGQMFVNIASMVALTPLTGIPLPFFSAGGSSLSMILAALGIVLSISKDEKNTFNGITRRNHGLFSYRRNK